MSLIAVIQPELTAATVVAQDGRFLLVEEMSGGRRVFNQPAGHVEPGETIIEAAVRETREETAWQVIPTALVGMYYWPQTPRGDCILRCTFAAEPDSHDAEQPLDDGILAIHWLTRDEIVARQAQLRSPMVLAAVDAWLDGTRLPLSAIHHVRNASR